VWRGAGQIVEGLCSRVSVPITVKMRVLEDEKRTLRLAKAFQDAGAQLLTGTRLR
jgi:tRNA-dihydrouridine synthase